MNKTFHFLKNTIKTIICALLLVISTSVFVGCNEQDNSINTLYYVATTSTYSLQTSNNEFTTTSTDFVTSEQNFRQYDKITVNLSSEWLYNFELNKFSFDITTNADCELQFKITITNLRNGNISDSINVKNKQFTFIRTYTANSTTTDAIAVRDIFDLSASKTCIIFELTNTEVYYNNNELNDFAFSLNNVTLFGEHIYS